MIQEKSSFAFDSINYLLLTLFTLATLFPVYYVFVTAFTSQAEYLKGGLNLWPKGFTLENFEFLLSTKMFPTAFGVSLTVTLVGTLLGLVVTSTMAYALSRKRLMGRKTFLMLVLVTILFQPGMIPAFLLIRDLGLMDSLWALILPGICSGWNVFLMKSFFDNIPESLEEAAIIDGCSDFGVFTRIILPLSMPALATFGLFFAVAYWNIWFQCLLYINDSAKWTLQLVLRQLFVDSSTNAASSSEVTMINPQTFKMAAVVLTIVPIMMVYPFLQKHFAKGVMLGSVKG